VKWVVIYESRTGTTARAATVIAAQLDAAGHDVAVFPTKTIDLKAVAEADAVVVGTWTDGAILFGQRPGGAGNLARHLPMMWDKPTYAYATYAIRAGGVLRGVTKLLASKGCDVRGALELHRRHIDTDAADFADAVVAAFTPAR
jgi:hypothetical protein